jgi:small subunit ribosomal protein S6
MKKYELMLILNPAMDDSARKELLDAVNAEFKAAGVTSLSEDVWGNRKMAYKINGSLEGFYTLFTFESEGNHNNIRKLFNLKKDVWRHMFVDIAE